MLRVAFAGTPEFALPALRALAASPHQLVGVLTQPDRPAGRGRGLKASPVKELAQGLGLPVRQPLELRSDPARAVLEFWPCDLLVVVAYGLLLPRVVLDWPRHGCLNIHASLLPRWRGAAPIQRAILAGDRETGVTIMRLEEGLDTGPMLAQRRLPIDEEASAGQLQGELAELGAALLIETIAAVEAGRTQPQSQPEQGVCYAAKIHKSEARIDWHRTAPELARQVRAFNPWPVAETLWRGERLRVWQARPTVACASAGPPGRVLGLVDGALQVACGEGVLALTMLQLAGRRTLSAAEFARGQPIDGARCE